MLFNDDLESCPKTFTVLMIYLLSPLASNVFVVWEQGSKGNKNELVKFNAWTNLESALPDWNQSWSALLNIRRSFNIFELLAWLCISLLPQRLSTVGIPRPGAQLKSIVSSASPWTLTIGSSWGSIQLNVFIAPAKFIIALTLDEKPKFPTSPSNPPELLISVCILVPFGVLVLGKSEISST